MNAAVRRLTDGVAFQAVITGSLSFAHIHDLALRYGQTGWKAWTYPLSVDLLTVAAYRKMIDAHRAKHPVFLPWACFLMALGASLAANIIATGGRDPLSIAVGVWPAIAFLGCTLLGHVDNDTPTTKQATTGIVEPSTQDRTTIERTTIDRLTVESPVPAAQITAPVIPALPAVPSVSPDLLAYASKVATDHQDRHGEPISLDTLRTRLGVPPLLAQAVHSALTN